MAKDIDGVNVWYEFAQSVRYVDTFQTNGSHTVSCHQETSDEHHVPLGCKISKLCRAFSRSQHSYAVEHIQPQCHRTPQGLSAVQSRASSSSSCHRRSLAAHASPYPSAPCSCYPSFHLQRRGARLADVWKGVGPGTHTGFLHELAHGGVLWLAVLALVLTAHTTTRQHGCQY